MSTTFLSPIAPRPRARLMPTADELLGQRSKSDRLFASEEGGREPIDSPASPGLAKQFGFRMGAPTAQTDNQAAREGVLSRGYKSSLLDPGGDRRAARNAGISMESEMETPTSRESALERDYLQAQVAPSERADAKRAQVQRQAAKLAWEETYHMPYSEAVAKDIAEQVRKNDEDAGLMSDLSDMKADMDVELAAVDSAYPSNPMDPNSPTNVARQREQDRIRQKYMLDMNHLLTVRTRRNIEMGKKGQAPPATEDDLTNFGVR